MENKEGVASRQSIRWRLRRRGVLAGIVLVLLQGCNGSLNGLIRQLSANPAVKPPVTASLDGVKATAVISVTPTTVAARNSPLSLQSYVPVNPPLLLSSQVRSDVTSPIPEIALSPAGIAVARPNNVQVPLLISGVLPTPSDRVEAAPLPKPAAPSTPIETISAPLVLVYAPPATAAYFTKIAVNGKDHLEAWQRFLSRYRIPYEVTTSVERLERRPAAVLLLPSAVAMSDREKQAVVAHRTNGGAVLSTWQTGVRDEKGEWIGYDFMESALDTKVVGTTEKNEDDAFIIPHGDSPVAHSLPAGLRVWTERVKDWYPLRLVGKNTAAQIMDWSRGVTGDKVTGAMTFDERAIAAGKSSRSVVLNFPEKLWVSADPKAIDALAHNALTWLLRVPDAYVADWPHPFGSAFILAVDVADTPADSDVNIGKLVGDLGGKASFFVLGEQAAQSADTLKKFKTSGHELGYLGDHFVGFKNQSTAAQGKRLDSMISDLKTAKIEFAVDAGFHPPMESYDKTTEKVLQERAFGYFIVGPDASDARLPYFAPTIAPPNAPVPTTEIATEKAPDKTADTPSATPLNKKMVMLPRTQNGPDDLISEGDPVVGFKTFLTELDLAEKMGGLSVIRVPSQTALTAAQLAEISSVLKRKRDRMWLAPAGQVAAWWRARTAVSASVDTTRTPPLLTLTITGDKSPGLSPAVWVNLPEKGSVLRLVAAQADGKKLPKTASVDAWRDAIIVDGLAPGQYRWQLFFDRVATRGTP